jgi:3',5'-nucleoside bisphosphate phosphatase
MTRFWGLIVISASLIIPGFCEAQERSGIHIPDVLGYKTLTADLHTHTVLSDGLVWPTVRTEEALREGVDIIAITDHVEATNLFRFERIFGDDLKIDEEGGYSPDRNRPFKIAKEAAEGNEVFVINGAEISRTMPPGHHNALFLTDVNKLNTPHPEWKEAFLVAKDQGAFIFWNHPASFQDPEPTTLWWEEHTWLLENEMMHGIEVVNGKQYDPVAHQWALDKNLAIIGNTDIHAPIGMSYAIHEGEKRTMTLVFTTERSLEGIKEALFARRTAAFYDNKLVGPRHFLDAIFTNSIAIESVERIESGLQAVINNQTDIPFSLSKAEGNDPSLEFLSSITFPAGKHTTIKVYSEEPSSHNKIDLKMIVNNLLIAPEKGLPVTLTLAPK